jgi:hypothetical protein
MKANELMIEDWVYNKNIDKPMQVYPMMFSQMFRRTPNATTEDYNIFPIPLTPEILEKNGWEERPTGYVFYTDGKRYDNSLWYIFDSNTFVVNTTEFQIKYVHQFQHALRLCGINKTIEL